MTATFHKIDQDSENVITSALSFFDVPSTNVSISSSSVYELLTLNPVNIKPLHFKIHASNDYIDFSKCYILTELKIQKVNNATNALEDLEVDEDVSVCQAIGLTLWKNIRVSVNGTQVFEGNSLMAYKSFLDFELTYPESVKSTYLNTSGYYVDSETSQTTGSGYEARKALFSESKTAQFIAKLDVDLANQPRLIVNQCEIDIELLPNESDFLIVSPTAGNKKYQLQLLACKMYLKKIELMDSLALDIHRKLEMKPARYPIRKTSIKSFFISPGRTEFHTNLWIDQVPRRVVLGMLNNADYVGTLTTSPFNFKPFNVRDISVSASGKIHPAAPYNLDFPNSKFARAYHDMQDAIGYAGAMVTNGISAKKFAEGGLCLFVFNLTPSSEDSADTFDLIKNGTTMVKIAFDQAVPAGGICLIAMAELDGLLMLDKNRTISTDITI